MPAAEVETTCTTPVIGKEVEAFPEKTVSNCREEETGCKEAKTAKEETMKTEESEKMENENFPEKENKDVSNTCQGNEEKTDYEGEVSAENAADEPTKTTENSKRKSTKSDADSEIKEEESPPKKRKST